MLNPAEHILSLQIFPMQLMAFQISMSKSTVSAIMIMRAGAKDAAAMRLPQNNNPRPTIKHTVTFSTNLHN